MYDAEDGFEVLNALQGAEEPQPEPEPEPEDRTI